MKNSLAYWRNWDKYNLDKELELNSYVVFYKIENRISKEIVNNWISCSNTERLISFIKYVLLPSTYITQLVGKNNKSINLGVYDYQEALEVLKYCEEEGFEKALQSYIENFQLIRKIEDRGNKIEEIMRFLENFQNNSNNNLDILTSIDVFSNLKSIGRELVQIYKAKGNLAYIENAFNMSNKEIVDFFDNIDRNVFMLKKIKIYLCNIFQE